MATLPALETGKEGLRKETVHTVQLRRGRARVSMLSLSLFPAACWGQLCLTLGLRVSLGQGGLLPSSSCPASLQPAPSPDCIQVRSWWVLGLQAEPAVIHP